MKKTFGTCGIVAAGLALGLTHPAFASSQAEWVRQLGTSQADVSVGVATDNEGNAFISGYAYGSLGGPNQGADDAWLAN